MAQELTGLVFLKKNEIKNMKYDENKPFAFISYSHDDHDSQIVMNVFKKMYEKGYNLWIDVANIPHDENSWTQAAEDAFDNRNCKCAIFFRSENSMIKETIVKEIKNLKIIKHILRIIVVDIWEDEAIDSAEAAFEMILNSDNKEAKSNCRKLCDIVSVDNSAIRLDHEAENDIDKAVDAIIDEIKEYGIVSDAGKKDTKAGDTPVQKPKAEVSHNGENTEENDRLNVNPLDGGSSGKHKHKPAAGEETESSGHSTPSSHLTEEYYLQDGNDANAVIRFDGTDYFIMKNSKISNKLNDSVKKTRDSHSRYIIEYKNGIKLVNEDFKGAISTLCKFASGYSTDGNTKKKISKEEALKILRENVSEAGTTPAPPTTTTVSNPPAPPVTPTGETTYYSITRGGVNAVIRKDSNGYTLLKNSKIKEKYNNSIREPSKSFFDEKSVLTEKGRFTTEDFSRDRSSALAGVVFGGSENGNAMIQTAKVIFKEEALKILRENAEGSKHPAYM